MKWGGTYPSITMDLSTVNTKIEESITVNQSTCAVKSKKVESVTVKLFTIKTKNMINCSEPIYNLN